MPIQFSLLKTSDSKFITVFVPGRDPLPAGEDHPNFDAIVAACVGGERNPDEIADLFDVASTVEREFERLSERVTVVNGRVYFDGDEVDSALTHQILRFLDEGADFLPLVYFFEKIAQNPNADSREQLYGWLQTRDFTIDPSGDFVAYKAIASDGLSLHGGDEDVLVDGEVHRGRIPNPYGAVVEMARSLVHHDPYSPCSRGLHVGTWDFASAFGGARSKVVEVYVNPRDVISVPHADEKIRTCRYEVGNEVEAAQISALAEAIIAYGDQFGADEALLDDLELAL